MSGENYKHRKEVAKNKKNLCQEVRTVKGEKYHPSTLYNIAMVIRIYVNALVNNTINIMEDD